MTKSNNSNLTVRVEREVRQEAAAIAKYMGLTLSDIVENKLREFIREQYIAFDARHPPAKYGDFERTYTQRVWDLRREIAMPAVRSSRRTR